MRLFNVEETYPYDRVFEGVITSNCALARNGLTYDIGGFLNLATSNEELDGISVNVAKYIFVNGLDTKNYLKPMETNKNLLLPTRERSLVEYIQIEKYRDEGVLIEALKNYLEETSDLSLLFEVADFYMLDIKELNYWIKEAQEDFEI